METAKYNEKLFEPLLELIKQHKELPRKEEKTAIALMKRFGITRLAFWSDSFLPERPHPFFPVLSEDQPSVPSNDSDPSTAEEDSEDWEFLAEGGDRDEIKWFLEDFGRNWEAMIKERREQEKGLPQRVNYNEADAKLLGELRPPFNINIKNECRIGDEDYTLEAIAVEIKDGRLHVLEFPDCFNTVSSSPVTPGRIGIYRAMVQSIKFNLDNNIPPSKWGLAHHRFVDPYTYKVLVKLHESEFARFEDTL